DRAVHQGRRVRQPGVPPAEDPRREGRAHPRGGAGRVADHAVQGAGGVHRRRRRGPVQARALPLLAMGYIVAIEGIDGAGKNTLSSALDTSLSDAGVGVVKLGFPAYGRTPFADFADDALHGRLGDVAGSAWAMALLFALDRRDMRDEVIA